MERGIRTVTLLQYNEIGYTVPYYLVVVLGLGHAVFLTADVRNSDHLAHNSVRLVHKSVRLVHKSVRFVHKSGRLAHNSDHPARMSGRLVHNLDLQILGSLVHILGSRNYSFVVVVVQSDLVELVAVQDDLRLEVD